MNLPHILLVTPHIPHPAFNGGEARIISLLRCLEGKYRFSLLTFFEHDAKARGLAGALILERGALHKVHLVERKPEKFSPKSWMPRYAQDFRSKGMAARLRALISKESIDLVHVEFNEMAQYTLEAQSKVPVVFTEHDVSILSRRRSYLPEVRSWGPRRLWDWKRQGAYERKVLRPCDRVIVLTQADLRRLRPFTDPKRIEVIPTGVDLEKFPVSSAKKRKANALVFVGHYRHYPNEDAAVFFCREIMPRVARRIAQAHLLLVGSDPTAPVRALGSKSVQVTGTVAAVQPYLSRAQVFVAPLRLGQGIKGKILEAFSSGIPVVATPQAREGIPQARHGEHLLIAQTPAAFSRAICHLLKKPRLRQRLAKNARLLVEKSYQWNQQADRLDRLYQGLLHGKANRR